LFARHADLGYSVLTGMAVIRSEIDKMPIAEPEAVYPIEKKRLGALAAAEFTIPESFFEPLPEEELRLWNGEEE
jgi:hypothetical protein